MFQIWGTVLKSQWVGEVEVYLSMKSKFSFICIIVEALNGCSIWQNFLKGHHNSHRYYHERKTECICSLSVSVIHEDDFVGKEFDEALPIRERLQRML